MMSVSPRQPPGRKADTVKHANPFLRAHAILTLEALAAMRDAAPIVAAPRMNARRLEAFNAYAADAYEADEPSTMRSPTFGPSVTMADAFFGGAK